MNATTIAIDLAKDVFEVALADSDAAALVQAARDPDILPVAIKSEYQQSIMALHRIRSAWVAHRTARINRVRGLPRVFAEGLLPAVDEIRDLDSKIDAIDKQLSALARQSKDAMRLQQIPGIGVMTATALANKIARIAWAIWRHDRPFNGSFAAA